MDNIYRAPAAPLLESTQQGAFFVTSIRKMLILHFATIGIYSLYWFYKQWSSQRASMTASIWPVMRAIFAIFFVHSLSRRMNESLEAQQLDTPRYNGAATGYVLITLTSVGVGRATEHLDLPLFAAIVVDLIGVFAVLPLVGLQRKANVASGDAEGESNSSMSTANVLCLVLGALLWSGLIWAYIQVA